MSDLMAKLHLSLLYGREANLGRRIAVLMHQRGNPPVVSRLKREQQEVRSMIRTIEERLQEMK